MQKIIRVWVWHEYKLMGENVNLSVINCYKNILKQDYIQMFATYKDNPWKYLNIKVYYRFNVFWDKIYTSLHIANNILNGSLKFTKYIKRIIGFVHGLFKFPQKDENKVPLKEE